MKVRSCQLLVHSDAYVGADQKPRRIVSSLLIWFISCNIYKGSTGATFPDVPCHAWRCQRCTHPSRLSPPTSSWVL